MRKLSSILSVLALAVLSLGGVACKKSETTVNEHLSEAGQEMKEAGQNLAQAGEKVGDAAAAAGEGLGKAAEEAAEETAAAAERAGEKLEAGAESAAGAASDAAITARVKARLLADPEVKGVDINVETSAGVVTLTGTAATRAQADEAVKLARNTEGVKSVVNNIQITG